MILREVDKGVSKPYSFSGMQKIVQRMRKEIGLPPIFTLDACRHGGMTELEEAQLTEGQGRALSAHRTRESYAGYAKRTEARMLSATRKRHAHLLANEAATSVQNEERNGVQNERQEKGRIGEQNQLAGAGGIEPPNGGIKIRCLTAWLRPNWQPGNGAEERATADSLRSQPVYRESSGISTAWRAKIPRAPARDAHFLL